MSLGLGLMSVASSVITNSLLIISNQTPLTQLTCHSSP